MNIIDLILRRLVLCAFDTANYSILCGYGRPRASECDYSTSVVEWTGRLSFKLLGTLLGRVGRRDCDWCVYVGG